MALNDKYDFAIEFPIWPKSDNICYLTYITFNSIDFFDLTLTLSSA